METWKIIIVALLAIYYCTQVNFVTGLECYVCSNQTGNVEKCLNTIKTCEPGEDVCGTEIRWGSQPYFSQGALKQYYVSKRCMTKQRCLAQRKRHMPYCTHIWYEDWSCHECCRGDRCNYFIISGSSKKGHSFTALSLASIATILFACLRKQIV
ncbi:coiled [Haematobia irritans]|uniref:coiled n=1 Tax=Haematobia irritans TaxID=7368 RepID=UPI003F4FE5DA